ncbi:hypothetical protein MKX01_018742 [Papaver californicum]|nr:hypothetical protein MKX01_018742 [Papaver californicum]
MESISIWSLLVSIIPYLLCIISFFIFIEQITYIKKKKSSPGQTLILPFLGNVIQLIRNPTQFSEDAAKALSHKVYVRPDAFHFVGHPFGKKLFGEHNLIYLSGQEHKDLWGRIAPNFTPKALSTYLSLQRRIILEHLTKWVSLSIHNGDKPLAFRFLCRDMNLDTSQAVFVGPYLNEKSRVEFNIDYNLFNEGILTLPIDLPGFGFQKARLAVNRLVETLTNCVKQSKMKLQSGEEPVCLIDFWMQQLLTEIQENGSDSNEVPHSSEVKIGGHLFDFLYAAQDASTSSLLWAVTLLEKNPEILSKVRQEVSRIWSPDSGKLITGENLTEMKYTEAVARELMRYRAPAPLVPHMAGEDFQLTESYTIPKGTMVFPVETRILLMLHVFDMIPNRDIGLLI